MRSAFRESSDWSEEFNEAKADWNFKSKNYDCAGPRKIDIFIKTTDTIWSPHTNTLTSK